MWRNVTTRALTMTVLLGLSAQAPADDGLPSLDAPAEHATSPAPAPTPVPSPAQTVPSLPPPPPAARADRGVLALPGITSPTSRAARPASPAPRLDLLPPPSLAPSADGGLPMLEGPEGRRPAGPVGSGSPGGLTLPSERFGTRVIESTPVETTLPPLSPLRARPTPLPDLIDRGAPVFLGGSPGLRPLGDLPSFDGVDDLAPKRPRASDLDPEDDLSPGPPPARRPGLLGGRFLPRLGTGLGLGGGAGMNPPASRFDSAIKAEPRTDPAADAAIKRRVERQAREAVGDRVRSLDVRVIGRDVTIRASGTRILQRRAVRRSLETMPGLSGYRSTVVVDD